MKKVSRVIQMVIGFAIFISLFTTVYSENEGSYRLIWKFLTPAVLKVIVWIFLLLISIRLIYGKLIHDGESTSLILKLIKRLRR